MTQQDSWHPLGEIVESDNIDTSSCSGSDFREFSDDGTDSLSSRCGGEDEQLDHREENDDETGRDTDRDGIENDGLQPVKHFHEQIGLGLDHCDAGGFDEDDVGSGLAPDQSPPEDDDTSSVRGFVMGSPKRGELPTRQVRELSLFGESASATGSGVTRRVRTDAVDAAVRASGPGTFGGELPLSGASTGENMRKNVESCPKLVGRRARASGDIRSDDCLPRRDGPSFVHGSTRPESCPLNGLADGMQGRQLAAGMQGPQLEQEYQNKSSVAGGCVHATELSGRGGSSSGLGGISKSSTRGELSAVLGDSSGGVLDGMLFYGAVGGRIRMSTPEESIRIHEPRSGGNNTGSSGDDVGDGVGGDGGMTDGIAVDGVKRRSIRYYFGGEGLGVELVASSTGGNPKVSSGDGSGGTDGIAVDGVPSDGSSPCRGESKGGFVASLTGGRRGGVGGCVNGIAVGRVVTDNGIGCTVGEKLTSALGTPNAVYEIMERTCFKGDLPQVGESDRSVTTSRGSVESDGDRSVGRSKNGDDGGPGLCNRSLAFGKERASEVLTQALGSRETTEASDNTVSSNSLSDASPNANGRGMVVSVDNGDSDVGPLSHNSTDASTEAVPRPEALRGCSVRRSNTTPFPSGARERGGRKVFGLAGWTRDRDSSGTPGECDGISVRGAGSPSDEVVSSVVENQSQRRKLFAASEFAGGAGGSAAPCGVESV